MIQRGVVLSRDELNARYLVLFESKDFGCEYCPDSEVASHGGPTMLKVLGAQRFLSSAYDYSGADGVSSLLGAAGSRFGPSIGKFKREARRSSRFPMSYIFDYLFELSFPACCVCLKTVVETQKVYRCVMN